MIFFSTFAAMIVGATAYLQAEAAWWKCLAGAAALYALGSLAFFLMPDGAIQTGVETPGRGLVVMLGITAALVAVGSVFALTLRSWVAPVRLGVVAFVASLALIWALGWVAAFSLS